MVFKNGGQPCEVSEMGEPSAATSSQPRGATQANERLSVPWGNPNVVQGCFLVEHSVVGLCVGWVAIFRGTSLPPSSQLPPPVGGLVRPAKARTPSGAARNGSFGAVFLGRSVT